MASLLQYSIKFAESPFWAVAVHDGHQLAPGIEKFMRLNDAQRLREEDPYTASIAELPVNQLVVGSSRFQLDVNRKKEDAIYIQPEQAWGLSVWKEPLPSEVLTQLYDDYTRFYQEIDRYIEQTIEHYGFFIVFDVHTYNARRKSEDEVVDVQANPQINLGTVYNQAEWRPVIDGFIESVQRQQLLGDVIDIRENIKFKGGHLAQHILHKFGAHGCVLSIEFRKDFMNEWTGQPYQPAILAYKQLLLHVLKDLQNLTIYGV
mgnify:CR=1 FL=1